MSNTTQTPEQRIAHDLGLTLAEMGSIVRAERIKRKGPELVEALRACLPVWESGIREPWVENARTLLAEIDAPIEGGAA